MKVSKNGLKLIQQRDEFHISLLITGKSVKDKENQTQEYPTTKSHIP